MLGNNTMETASTEVTSIRRRNNVEKSTWKTHRYFVDFESRIHVEISTSNRCHNFHVDSPFKIDVVSTNFPRGISTIGNQYVVIHYRFSHLLLSIFVSGFYVDIQYSVCSYNYEVKCIIISCISFN